MGFMPKAIDRGLVSGDCIYIADESLVPEDYIYVADMSSDGCMYAPWVGPIPDIDSAGMPRATNVL